ncbi:MAG: iron ABC transporter permease [Bacteroidales bacterium]|nr:iron ABC transporter permease [Bacteroidales bacterium]
MKQQQNRGNFAAVYLLLGLALLLLFLANILAGPVKIPLAEAIRILLGKMSVQQSWNQIVLGSRLPQAVTALLGGAALAVSGLQLQTLFKNPLAGPSILGISDGANLGVALAMLYISTTSYLTTIFAAFAGAAIVLAIIIWFSRKVHNNVMLLIIGIMVGYLASSVISILNFNASADKVHQYVMWGMGDFSSVSMDKLPWFVSFTVAGLVGSLLLVKPLNALLLGDSYAENLGINVRRSRLAILIITGVLTAAVTAFCGPISFIGLAVPHIARLLLGSSNHRNLVPVTILSGSVVALLCNFLANLGATGGPLPLNAITSIVGAPIIIYVIMNRKNLHYFD